MVRFIRRFAKDEDGPTAVEYAVMLAMIVGVCIASVRTMAQQAGASFDRSAGQIQSVMGS